MPNKGPIVTHYHLVDRDGDPINTAHWKDPSIPIPVDIADVSLNLQNGTLDITLVYPPKECK